jgi:hypothetical protein
LHVLVLGCEAGDEDGKGDRGGGGADLGQEQALGGDEATRSDEIATVLTARGIGGDLWGK